MTDITFHTIGIGIAFSPNLKANIYEAARLSNFFGSKLVLIHVGAKSDEKISEINKIIEPFVSKDFNYKIIFRVGNPVEVILSSLKQEGIDLLVLGALEHENILKYYLGSIARKITRKATCSILLLTKPSVERVPCQHIVVNGLNNPLTMKAICTAFFVANRLKSKKITIVEEITKREVAVNIYDDRSLRKSTIKRERLKHREDSRVKKIIEGISEDYKKNLIIKTQPIFGKRGYSIGHYAQYIRADLLVMNAPLKTSFLDRLFPHDIEYILKELPTDVLIIR